MIKAIESVYLAGKMQATDWRIALFDTYDYSDDHAHQLGCNPLTVEDRANWPDNSRMTVHGLNYTGPFFVDVLGGHGYSYFDEHEHGGNVQITDHVRQHGAELECIRDSVRQRCLQAIAKSDLLFAWIDCIDCYGTLAEIGYAKALGKVIWIASPRQYNDLWFVYSMADRVAFSTRYPVQHLFQELLHEHRRYHPQFNSPIEQAFWDEWIRRTGDAYSLTPQYSIGKYRVDFAHVTTKTAIELDGFASHSSTDDIANDRKRQREIEKMGWHVIRFGGKEVHRDAATCVIETQVMLRKREGKPTIIRENTTKETTSEPKKMLKRRSTRQVPKVDPEILLAFQHFVRGDRVRHPMYGDGIIEIESRDGSPVWIRFDSGLNSGWFAYFANLQKIE